MEQRPTPIDGLVFLRVLFLLPRDYFCSLPVSPLLYRRALCNGGRGVNVHHRHLLGSSSAKPPVLPPISKDDLPKAYNDKHKDSDYGFQHEFELLPDKFADRTTKNSDMKENMPKNRYPDIKAYDQTRVKLTPLNGLAGSDYINANFVIGYKERKKFICAQGPMDATINDFWRMIWEQHLEIIVMLTNLEEYNKTKCAKYWPESTNDSIQYGELLITFQSLTYYADYIIRTLKVGPTAWQFIILADLGAIMFFFFVLCRLRNGPPARARKRLARSASTTIWRGRISWHRNTRKA